MALNIMTNDKSKLKNLNFATWNVLTLSDGKLSPVRKTAILAQELDRYNIDIAALQETRLSESGLLIESKSGYHIYWSGRPATEPKLYGVGFAIKSSLAQTLPDSPVAISERLMMLRIPLAKKKYMTILSVYAPTMTHDIFEKELFYADLRKIMNKIKKSDKLLILGDFNARVGRDSANWQNVLGQHGVGSDNSNGNLLLSLCQEYQLVITNTVFRMAHKYKTTWMHPRSKQWHLIDYVITRQKDLKDVMITRAMRGADCGSDHRLVRAKLRIKIYKSRYSRPKKSIQLDLNHILQPAVQQALCYAINTDLHGINCDNTSTESTWKEIADKILLAAKDVLGTRPKRSHDWFAENETELLPLVLSKRNALLAWQNNINSLKLRSDFISARSTLQSRARELKNVWWKEFATQVQAYYDIRDMKNFFHSFNVTFGPRRQCIPTLLASDNCSKLTSTTAILQRWSEHFQSVLNIDAKFDSSAIASLPTLMTNHILAEQPTFNEVQVAITSLSNGKCAGADGVPSELLKYGGDVLHTAMHNLILQIWNTENVPQSFKDATVLPLYKKKGSKMVCGNYRGISLLSVGGKVLAKILVKRLGILTEEHLSESQCGFRPNRSTNDMIFVARQLFEKSREQRRPLYACFIDFTKAFDSVPRKALWIILKKYGCPDKIINIIKGLHDNMEATVSYNNMSSASFKVNNGTKQGCVLAPSLFAIYLNSMLQYAFKHYNGGVKVHFRYDGGLFKLTRFNAKRKITQITINELLYADDCVLFDSDPVCLQNAISLFAAAADKFGLSINLEKTVVMVRNENGCANFNFSINGTTLSSVSSFKYLGSILASNCTFDNEVTQRIAAASQAFGALRGSVWSSRDLELPTKVATYKALILPVLLYSSESWCLYKRHVNQLERFHQRCLRSILQVKWQDFVPNTEVLAKANVLSMEAMLTATQLRWAGHVIRMTDERLPKQILFSELKEGSRKIGAPTLRFKDTLKSSLKNCNLLTANWEQQVHNRSSWRKSLREGVEYYESSKVAHLQQVRNRRKNRQPDVRGDYLCTYCGKFFISRIGLYSHEKAHTRISS